MNSNKSLVSFILGTLLGAGIAYLFLTKRGEEIRNKISSILKEKGISLPADELDELIESLKTKFNNTKPEINDAADNGTGEV